MVEYQEKRDNTFGMTLQRQLDYFHSEKKRTEEKLKALGPQKLTVTLTDYLKSPPPPPSVDLRTPITMYFETFCQSLNEDEENVSFMDLLNGPTITNHDSHQISTMDQHVWDMDANQWLDELMADLEEPPPPETADSWICDGDVTDWLDDFIGDLEDPSSWENTVDVHDLLHDVENNVGDSGHDCNQYRVVWQSCLHPILVGFSCSSSFSWGPVFSWQEFSFFSHCRNPIDVSTFCLGPNLPTRVRVLIVLLLEQALFLCQKDWRLTFFPRVLRRSRMASKRVRISSPRLVEGLPLRVDALPFFTRPEGVMCGLGVDGLPFIMRFNHCSTGPVTKSPSSSSSSPGGPPGAPTPAPPGN